MKYFKMESLLLLFNIILTGYLIKKTHCIMAKIKDFQDQLARIDEATNNIAADIETIKGQITGAGLDEATEAEVLATLTAAADKLTGLAAQNPGTPPVGGEPGADVDPNF